MKILFKWDKNIIAYANLFFLMICLLYSSKITNGVNFFYIR